MLADGPSAAKAESPAAVSANGFYGSRPPVKQEQVTQRALPTRSTNTDSSHGNLYPIEGLSPWAHKWTIKARVTQKGDIKSWHNNNGEGRLFSVNLLDESGEIRATVFASIGDHFDALYEQFQEGGVYYISAPCQVKGAKKQFSTLNNDYELAFERDTKVETATDQADVPQVRYNFTTIGDLQSVEKDTTIDTIGVLKEVGEVSQIVSKSTQKPYDKRELTLVDNTLHQVRLTIWGKAAASFEAPVESVIAFKGVKVSDFGGRSLSLLASGSMSVDPDIDEAHRLKGWYDAQGRQDNFASHSSLMAPSAGNPDQQTKTIAQAKEENLGMNEEKPDYYTMKGTIVYIKQENISYPACGSEDCNKKVVEVDPGSWRCEKCERNFPKPQYRFVLMFNVSDHTGSIWLNCFDDHARIIMGRTADEMNELKESEETKQVEQIFQEANCKSYSFRVKAKMDNYKDEARYAIPPIHEMTTVNTYYLGLARKL
jgi:replication factor A1